MSKEKKKLLAVFAHPDDETFGTGGTLARYASNDTHVTLVCATRGEAGEIADPSLAKPETLGQVREAELECAAHKMGVQQVLLLNYRDSGMDGTPENEHPRALMNAPADKVVRQIVTVIRLLQPEVVVTFEPYGVYGHPDHIAIHHHTVTAFHAAADPTRFPDAGPPWQAERLFYSVLPSSTLRSMRDWLVSQGEDPGDLDRFEEPGATWPEDQIHVRLDVSPAVDIKWSALTCHETQFGPDNLFRRMPQDLSKRILSQEHFALAWPAPKPDLRLDGLFDGL